MNFIKYVAALGLALTLTACGGGGGNPGKSLVPEAPAATASSPVTADVAAPSVTIYVYNSAGAKVNYVSSSDVFTARATVLNAAGKPVDSVLVTFSNLGYASLALANTTRTTGADGVASVVVSPSTSSTGDGVSLSASATVDGTVVTRQIDLNVAVGSSSTAAPTLTVDVYQGSLGLVPVFAVSYGQPFEVRATLKNASGGTVPNTLVTFDMGAFTNAVVAPASLLTNNFGVATVSVTPSSISAVGGATVKASAQVGAASVSNQTSFNVAPTSITLSPISLGSASLVSAGNTSLDVTVNISGTPASGVPISVTYTTSCGRINGTGISTSVVTNGSGVASASFEAVNSDGTLCDGPVTLIASSGSVKSDPITVTVARATANAITYVSPGSSVQIFVAGTGALEQSIVEFKVLSGATPMPNQQVTFSLLTNPGGVGLNATGATADVLATTNSSGVASVTVFSGTIPGPVKVRAALTSNSSVFAETQSLTVASGPASQRFMSLSVEKFNIEGWIIDGATTKLTVRVADRQGNAVANGTVVNFTAEGGQVAHSCATVTVNLISSCSVDFVSQNPRPVGGRASVLAYLAGTKDYVDTNGDNRFDAANGDVLVPIGDAYRDDNENGLYDSSLGEFVIPRNGAEVCVSKGWPFPSRIDTCDNSLATTVRQQAVLLFASSSPLLTVTSPSFGVNSASVHGLSFSLNSFDNQLLPMPAGTVITAKASGQSGSPPNVVKCSVDELYGTTVPNISPSSNPAIDLGTQHAVTLKDCATGSGNTVAVTVTTPGAGTRAGLATTFVFPIP